jgi:hypothetical protein
LLPTRPRHPDKELEQVLKDAKARNWLVICKQGYYKMFCPCPEKHKKNVALTPSGAYYVNHLRQWLQHYTCWDKGDKP